MELSDAADSDRRVRIGHVPHSATRNMNVVVFLAVSSSVSGAFGIAVATDRC